MAQLIVVYWRDIPAQVIVKQRRETAKRQLAERFETAIDRAAMHAKLAGTDDYLNEWRRADPVEVSDNLEAEAEKAAAAIEADYPDDRLKALSLAGGIDGGT